MTLESTTSKIKRKWENCMMYIVSLVKNMHNEISNYRVFDNLSQSFMTLDKESLMSILLHTKIQVVNARIQDNDIILKDWAHGICTEKSLYSVCGNSGVQYVALERNDNTYKIVSYNGSIHYWNTQDLEEKVKLGQVANCKIIGIQGELKLETEDVCTMSKDEDFEKLIESKYDNFKTEMAMMGHKNMTFDFEIENNEVSVRKYTGLNRHVILPSFVTVIRRDAFCYASIDTIDLNEGLKIIGARAFMSADTGDSLERIEIPSTVELIGDRAFNGNAKMFEDCMNIPREQCKLSKDKFKLRNNKTIVLKQTME